MFAFSKIDPIHILGLSGSIRLSTDNPLRASGNIWGGAPASPQTPPIYVVGLRPPTQMGGFGGARVRPPRTLPDTPRGYLCSTD